MPQNNNSTSSCEIEFKNVRFCISDNTLLKVTKEMEIDSGMNLDKIAKLALEEKMEREGYNTVKET